MLYPAIIFMILGVFSGVFIAFKRFLQFLRISIISKVMANFFKIRCRSNAEV